MILRSVKHMTSMERKDYHRKFMPTFFNKELGLEGRVGGRGGGLSCFEHRFRLFTLLQKWLFYS